ncbi:MAG: autotransporter, partial [Burkholderiaceae bacterium]|nr:autotransporter [Burkholderiaceae bacterium]
VDDKLNVLGRLEGVHRFNDTGAAVSGDVAGLYGFNLPGQTYKRNWLRAAIGFEGKVGAGTASMMLNGSTQSDGTKYWVAANYRYDF